MAREMSPSNIFPHGWNQDTRCYICGSNRSPYELIRHYKRAHFVAWQANLSVGDHMYQRPPRDLPSCKLFIGHGSDARDLHDQKELHKFRASIGWARVIRRLKCKVRAAVGMEVLRENDGLLRQRGPWQSAEAPLMLASVIQVSIGRLRRRVVSAGATPN